MRQEEKWKNNYVLRSYQQEMMDRLYEAWRKFRSVMVQMPTGTGKIHQPLFEHIKRADDGFFAYCTYPYPVYKSRVTVIDKDGRDLGVKMYGHLEWDGKAILKGLDINGEPLYWDRRYNNYYHEKPEFVSLGGIEMTRLSAGYVLRRHPSLIKPTSKRNIYYVSQINAD